MSVGRRTAVAGALALASFPARAAPLAAVPIDRLQTKWWRERHEAKLREKQAGPVDLVFLGDSIIENFEKSGAPGLADFRPVWQRFYGDRHALNLGFKGDATSHLLWRLTHGEIDGIAPKAAVLLIGANNLGRAHWPTADNITGIAAIVATVRQKLPRTNILLLGILPSIRSAWASQTTAEMNAALAARYATGRVPMVTYINAGHVLERAGHADPALFYDSNLSPPEPALHPTPDGMARLAAAIEPALAAMLGDRRHDG
jgi:lysophospholipase L1-like esterase